MNSAAGVQVFQEHPLALLDEVRLIRRIELAAQGEACSIESIGIILAGRAFVHELNRTHLNHDYPTDVLSFPLHQKGEAIEGEIYIDVETAAERHLEFEATLEDEVHRYAVHGFLHLAGYDDETPEQRRIMRTLEDKYLSINL